MRRKRIRRLMRTMALGPKRVKALYIWRQTLTGDGTKSGKSNHFSKCCSTGLRVLRCRAGDREINQGDLAKQFGTRVNHSIADPALNSILHQQRCCARCLMLTIGPHRDRRAPPAATPPRRREA
jgi:hypothetical protein